jgi:Ser/Thr protein kinase RdoA (MazF antagonist)
MAAACDLLARVKVNAGFDGTATVTGDRREVPLGSDRTTTGVVRIGRTVRRPPTPNSDFVQRLLRRLAASGFEGAPAPLGVDERGRDVLGFLEGEAPESLSTYDEATLRAAAALIRRYHDLAAELVASPAAQTVGIETVCHNDLSPCNFIFRAGLPVAIIDFDAAAPGARAYDLGYAAWLWLDMGSPEIEVAEQRRRLRLFVEAYDPRGVDVATIVACILARQTALLARAEWTGNEAMARWAAECNDWTRHNRQFLSAR